MNKKFLSLLGLFFILATSLFADEPVELRDGIYAEISTEKGNMLFQLNYKDLPLTVSNFLSLVEGTMEIEGEESKPFYDGLSFFRVVSNYALFSGDPSETGESNAGYSFPRESGGLYSAGSAGALVMLSDSQDRNSSLFIIMMTGDPYLDTKHTTFGQMVSDPKILKKIKRGTIIQNISIIRKGSEAENFEASNESVKQLIAEAEEAKREAFAKANPEVAQFIATLGEGVEESATGIFYKVTNPGSGAVPRPGSTVRMHYSGKLLNGQEFDNSRLRGQAFQFTIGKDGVIPGWIETAISMQVGEQRTIVIPPELGYGESGYGPIPPSAWLVFDIELIDFEN